jgi:hypothetical protein
MKMWRIRVPFLRLRSTPTAIFRQDDDPIGQQLADVTPGGAVKPENNIATIVLCTSTVRLTETELYLRRCCWWFWVRLPVYFLTQAAIGPQTLRHSSRRQSCNRLRALVVIDNRQEQVRCVSEDLEYGLDEIE